MKTAAVICEYNPFHRGHYIQVGQIREKFGEDCSIAAVMSGSYVQRGEGAIYDKYDRAEAAVRCGVDLVLELPYPWSCSCAEVFARAGVSIVDSLGFADALCFGCETFDNDSLSAAAGVIGSESYASLLAEKRRGFPDVSDINLREQAYYELCGDKLPHLPNDILAVEYMSAAVKLSSALELVPLKREEDYSATSARGMIRRGEALEAEIPEAAAEIFSELEAVDFSPLENAVMANLRLCSSSVLQKYADCGGGIAAHICDCAARSSDYAGTLALCSKKRWTAAHLRRCMLNMLFGVTDELISELPKYTVLLAANRRGLDLLHRRESRIEIITKPSRCSDEILPQLEMNRRADSLYALCRGIGGDDYLRRTPRIID